MTSDAHSEHAPHAAHGGSHVMPVAVLLIVFTALIVLTVITVIASYLPFGEFETWVALGIATLKGSLVAAYFMHLRYDNPLHAVLFCFGLMFVALFLGVTLMDIQQYSGDLINVTGRPTP